MITSKWVARAYLAVLSVPVVLVMARTAYLVLTGTIGSLGDASPFWDLITMAGLLAWFIAGAVVVVLFVMSIDNAITVAFSDKK